MIPILGEHMIGDDEDMYMANKGISIFNMCIDAAGDDELEIFDVDNLTDYLDFKWVTFARNIHLLGFVAHLFYITVLTLYTTGIYINDNDTHSEIYNTMIFSGIAYPAFYDFN